MSRTVAWGVALLLAGAFVWFLVTTGGRSAGDAALEGDAEHEGASSGTMTAKGLRGSAEKAKRAAERAREDEEARASISGRVVDDETSEGIAGVQLFCAEWHEDPEERNAARIGVSGKDGAFTIPGIADGRWVLVPFDPLYLHPFVGALFDDPLAADKPLPDGEALWKQAREHGLAFDVPGAKTEGQAFEIRLRRGPLVAGRVVDSRGAPVADAAIRVRFAYYGPLTELELDTAAARRLPLTRSNADGAFALRCFPAWLTQLRLGAVKPGRVGRWCAPIDMEDAEGIELLATKPATVEGDVRWSDGRPEPGAHVEVRHSREWLADVDAVETDAQGRFRVEGVPPEAVRVRAWAAGERPERGVLQLSEALKSGEVRAGLTVTLNDDKMIKGVLRGPDGKGLADECLCAYPAGSEEDRVDIDWTDDAGRFALAVEGKGAVDIWLTTGHREDVLLAGGLHSPQQRLVLTATPTSRTIIAVRVLDPDGKPIPRFRFEAWPYGDSYGSGERGEAGRASTELRGVEPPFFLHVSRPRDAQGKELPYAPYGMALAAAPTDAIEIRLATHAEFFGRVTDQDDVPIPGARLFVGERAIPIRADGRFRFTANDPSVRKITGARLEVPRGYRNAYAGILRAGKHHEMGAIGGGVALHGRIQVEGASPGSLEGIAVEAEWPPEPGEDELDAFSRAETDADGRFVFHALPKGKVITVTPDRGGLAERGLIADAPSVKAPSGASDVVFPARTGETIAGRLEGPGLADLDFAKVQVTVLRMSAMGIPDLSLGGVQPTATSPSFRLAGVAPGRHTVVLVRGDLLPLVVVPGVMAGRTDVVLRVPRLDGVIEGLVEMEGREQQQHVAINAWLQSAPNAGMTGKVARDGRFRFEGLPHGARFTLSLQASPNRAGLVAELSDVEVGRDVRLVARKGLYIEGRVLCSEGAPRVAGLFVHGRHGWRYAAVDLETGAFRAGPLPQGRYRLTAADGLRVYAEQDGVAAGTKGLEFVVK